MVPVTAQLTVLLFSFLNLLSTLCYFLSFLLFAITASPGFAKRKNKQTTGPFSVLHLSHQAVNKKKGKNVCELQSPCGQMLSDTLIEAKVAMIFLTTDQPPQAHTSFKSVRLGKADKDCSAMLVLQCRQKHRHTVI